MDERELWVTMQQPGHAPMSIKLIGCMSYELDNGRCVIQRRRVSHDCGVYSVIRWAEVYDHVLAVHERGQVPAQRIAAHALRLMFDYPAPPPTEGH